MGEVYNQGGVDLQLAGAFPVSEHLRIYGSVEYFQKSGYSLHAHQRTSFRAVPFNIGLQPFFKISSWLSFYSSIGPRVYLTYVHNQSAYIAKEMDSFGVGGFANVGFLFKIRGNLTLDLFTEGSYGRLSYSSAKPNHSYGQTVQVGGLTSGGGISHKF